jgi:hypothetical protein
MATNLRLRKDAVEALRREAHRTGRSQQDVIRDAVDRQLGLMSATAGGGDELYALLATGAVRRPRSVYRRAVKRLRLPQRVTSADLLDRHDRF